MKTYEGKTTPIAAVSAGLLLGGSTTFLLNLLQGCRASGCELPIVSLTPQNDHAADFARLAAVTRIMPERPWIYEDRLAWAFQKLAEFQPHAVLACLSAESFEMLRAAPKGVMRLGLIQSHDPLPYAMAKRYAPWIDAMVGVSGEICDTLRGMPEFASVLVEHVPYGIHFQPAAERAPRAASEPLRVIYLGRLIETQKRISRIVRVIQTADAQDLSIHFTIAGNGPDELFVQRELAGRRNVNLLGVVPNQEVPALLRKHDVLLLLSDFEGLPLSLLEAMGEGVVPVASDLPSGIQEAVAEGCGIRVPVGDIDAALSALRALAGDSQRLAQLSAAAASHARARFSAQRMAEAYLAVATLANPAAAWPHKARVPTPLVRHPWLFCGAPRRLRRLWKAVSARAPSSPS